jgi:amidase
VPLLTVIDDAEEFDGLPISLQLVGRRFEDEKVLAILEYILSGDQ